MSIRANFMTWLSHKGYDLDNLYQGLYEIPVMKALRIAGLYCLAKLIWWVIQIDNRLPGMSEPKDQSSDYDPESDDIPF